MKEINDKKAHPIKIKLDAFGHGAIWVGDVQLPNTRLVTFRGAAGELSTIDVEILCLDGIEIEATVQVLARFVDPLAPGPPSCDDVVRNLQAQGAFL